MSTYKNLDLSGVVRASKENLKFNYLTERDLSQSPGASELEEFESKSRKKVKNIPKKCPKPSWVRHRIGTEPDTCKHSFQSRSPKYKIKKRKGFISHVPSTVPEQERTKLIIPSFECSKKPETVNRFNLELGLLRRNLKSFTEDCY